jgi:hypothetical protein
MCALMGIRIAYSQAYHHQSNGRAEVAGQQLRERLRKLYISENINWVEALPQVIDRIHDVKGEGGLSPYEILFGRTRSIGNLPYQPEKTCEDAESFFKRIQEIDIKVSKVLNELHAKKAESRNKNNSNWPSLTVGTQVWYRRPEGTGNKLDTRWIGPGTIIAREGENSYVVQVKDGHPMKSHRTFLRPYQEDTISGNPRPIFP